jgi:hypothetical protein
VREYVRQIVLAALIALLVAIVFALALWNVTALLEWGAAHCPPWSTRLC